MMLSVSNLTFAYRKTPVLNGVSFTANEGELLAILGPNGVGKTTLFRCILGDLRRFSGTVALDGTDVKTLSARETARRIAYIPQAHPAAFRFPVRDVVLMGTTHMLSPLSSPKRREEALALAAMEKLGIAPLSDRSFDTLSGGERQLVYVARALAQQAKVLLMDEPTASLDYGNRQTVLSAARSLASDGYTVLLCTHEPQHALDVSDRILALSGGRVAALGATRETLTAALLTSLYGTPVDLIETERGRVILPSLHT